MASTAINIALALLWTVSAVAKIARRGRLASAVREYVALPAPLAAVAGFGLVLLEGLVAIFHWLDLAPGARFGLAVMLLSGFATVITHRLSKGKSGACHCFGLDHDRLSWWSVVRVAAIAILEVAVLRLPRTGQPILSASLLEVAVGVQLSVLVVFITSLPTAIAQLRGSLRLRRESSSTSEVSA